MSDPFRIERGGPGSGWQTTRHVNADRSHELRVAHRTGGTVPTYNVTLSSLPRPGHWRATQVEFIDGHPTATIYAAPDADGRHQRIPVLPPSPELRTLIETHHLDPTNSWMPLLDKLVEEYPDHFHHAVLAHTAARQSDAATQYAAAYASSASLD